MTLEDKQNKAPKKSWMDDYKDISEVFGGMFSKPKTKYSIWREREGRLVPMFVEPKDIQLKDIVFAESDNFDGYAFLQDFVRNTKGELDSFHLKPANIPVAKENIMLHIVENLLIETSKVSKENTNIILSLREKASK
jgi:hypothetical protein